MATVSTDVPGVRYLCLLVDLFEVVEVYSYKEPTTAANDYVALNLRINDTELAKTLYFG